MRAELRTIARAASVAVALTVGWLAAGPVVASPTVRAYVEPAAGVTDLEPLRLVIRVEQPGSGDVRVERLPPLENLRVVNGPAKSQNFRWVNGQSSLVILYTYTLVADAPGPAEVPAIDVRVGRATYRTEPIRFDVRDGAADAGTGGSGGAGEAKGARDDLILEVRLSKESAYVGEPIRLDVELLGVLVPSDLRWVSEPGLTNFWVEDVPVDTVRERRLVKRSGRDYYAWPLARKLLVPTKPGSYDLEYALRMTVAEATGDPFADFFRSRRGREVIRKSAPATLRVRPLPEEGRPDDFSGAVGTFSVRAEADRTTAEVDDAVAYRVVVEGEGFLKPVRPPELDPGPQFRVLDPRSQEETDVSGGTMRSKKVWEWVLVPLASGEAELPPVRFRYFDPDREAYRASEADPVALRVDAGDATGSAARSAGPLRIERKDIEFVKPLRGELREKTTRLADSTAFVVWLVAPVVVVPALIVLGRRRARYERNHGLVRARRAAPRARKALSGIERDADALDRAAFHEAVARVLVEYVADRFDRAPAGLTYDVADGLLAERGVDEALRGAFRSRLEACDFARFVPSSDAAERRADALRETRDLIERLERV